ncbi:MAG: hypothetical protein Q4F12_01425 [Erysipelotrichaceae bacterium]|nr:hypothetical protein [Erysipelotrichaceae bacterium]
MAKLVKRKRRRLSFFSKCSIVLTTSLMMWLFVSIFVGSINTSLTIDIQKMNTEVASLKAQNQQLSIDIQTLQNKDRIYTMAADAGLEQNQDNIISVNQGAISEAK